MFAAARGALFAGLISFNPVSGETADNSQPTCAQIIFPTKICCMDIPENIAVSNASPAIKANGPFLKSRPHCAVWCVSTLEGWASPNFVRRNNGEDVSGSTARGDSQQSFGVSVNRNMVKIFQKYFESVYIRGRPPIVYKPKRTDRRLRQIASQCVPNHLNSRLSCGDRGLVNKYVWPLYVGNNLGGRFCGFCGDLRCSREAVCDRPEQRSEGCNDSSCERRYRPLLFLSEVTGARAIEPKPFDLRRAEGSGDVLVKGFVGLIVLGLLYAIMERLGRPHDPDD